MEAMMAAKLTEWGTDIPKKVFAKVNGVVSEIAEKAVKATSQAADKAASIAKKTTDSLTGKLLTSGIMKHLQPLIKIVMDEAMKSVPGLKEKLRSCDQNMKVFADLLKVAKPGS